MFSRSDVMASSGPMAGARTLGLMSGALPPEADPVPRDIKKLVLVLGLGALSWVATYVGMLELIEANMGELPLVHRLIIGFSVAMLMTMIIWLLDQMFSSVGLFSRLCYVAGYVFLSIISVGFGFGFYWKVLESRSESSRSAEAAVSQVQNSLQGASTRLEQLNATLAQLASLSSDKAELERSKGTSCPNSKPGDGPRRKMREEDAARFAFGADFVKGRVSAVKAEMAALDGDIAKIASNDPSTIDPKSGTRNEFLKGLGRKLDLTVTQFNAFRSDPQLKQLRGELADRSDRTTFGDPKAGGFVCPDVQLTQALKGAVRAIDQLPTLDKPAIAAVEGSEATIEAFRRLTTTFYGLLSFKLPPSADELRELQKKAVQSLEPGALPAVPTEGGLSKRDYVPLAVAIFVDICLFLVAMGGRSNRFNGLLPKMREAERGPVIEILSRFDDIHRDRDIRSCFGLFQHVVFDVHGAYYVAVPLDAPPRVNPRERDELRVEAQLLSNLFTSFEQDGIFKRSWTPFPGTIRRKLRRQGSKFAEAEAFRVYRFRSGAWSELILGAVMGAARRAEAAAVQRRVAERFARPEDIELPASPVVAEPTARREAPERAAEPRRPEAPSRFARRKAPRFELEPELPDLPDAPSLDPDREPRGWRTARRDEADPRYSSQFGAYASRARSELETDENDEGEAPEAANSNTERPTARTVEPEPAEPEARVEEIVAVAERPERRATIDVVLKRETATVALPFDADNDALIGRIGEALAKIEDATLDVGTATELVDGPGAVALLTAPEDVEPMTELTDNTEQEDTMLSAIASRLRPAAG